MAVRVEIREGDWGVDPIKVEVGYADGSTIPAIPLGATATFTMVARGSGHRVTGSATIAGTNRNQLSWTPARGDTAKPGTYDACFVITYPGGERVTVPTCSSPAEGLVVEVCRRL